MPYSNPSRPALGLLSALALLLLAVPATAQGSLPLAGEHVLARDQRYTSASGAHYLVFQGDGNLVVYSASGQPLWALQEVGVDYRRTGRAVMQADGNFALYAADGAYLWSALTAEPDPAARLTISPAGALQLVSDRRGVLWASDGDLSMAGPAASAGPQAGTWQVHTSAARHSFGRTVADGDNEGFLSGADVPAPTSAGWSAASGWPGSNAGALQWSGPGGTPCRAQANYTYFQTAVTPEPGMRYELEFMNADDAARVSVTANGGTIKIPEYVGLREQKTMDLTPFLEPGVANRVVITLADVCGAGNGIRAELQAVPSGAASAEAEAGGETMTIDGTEVKTGPIQVTLEWDGPADLDLFVTDPAGEQVWYRNTTVSSGGLLDVDARADCQDTGSTVENIVWQGTPPAGTYRVSVDHYSECGQAGAVSYTATLRRNGQVVEIWRGAVAAEEDDTYSFPSN